MSSPCADAAKLYFISERIPCGLVQQKVIFNKEKIVLLLTTVDLLLTPGIFDEKFCSNGCVYFSHDFAVDKTESFFRKH